MSIARARTIVGSLYGLMRNALGLNVATPLESQELSCTVAPDRRLVVLGHEPIAGFARDHGTVADEAAMLALHTLDSSTLLAEPTFVAPGDSCLRADDPGWRWHCISGHGTTADDWERRPLGGAIAGLESAIGAAQPLDADLTAIAAQGVSAWGLTRLADSGASEAKLALSLLPADVGLGNVTNDAQLKASQLETDTTLSSDSDTKVPSTKAVRAFVAANAGGGSGELTLEAALLADAPLACWLMTDASGALVDEVGGRDLAVGGSGTLTRQYSPLADSAPVARWYGNLYATHASTLGIAAPWTGSWSFEAAVMLLESPASLMVLFQVGGLGDESEAGNSSVFAYVDSSRVLRMIWEYGVGNNVTFDATDSPLDLRRAYLVAAVKDSVAKTFEWCINGRLVFRSSYSQEPTGGSSSYTSVGASTTAGSVSAALLGPLAVYDRALSLTQLRAHARAARLG